MSIVIRCDHCQKRLGVSRRKLGKEITCPACGYRFAVRNPDQQPPISAVIAARSASISQSRHAIKLSDAQEEGGFTLRKSVANVEEMDLTPMVDVTFLLLIFFMITASFSLQKTIPVPPPNPEEKGAAQMIRSLEDLQAYSIIVQIRDDDSVLVDDEPVSDLDTLEELFLDKMAGENKSELVIEASDEARHETVVRVVDAGNGAKPEKIRLVTHAGGND